MQSQPAGNTTISTATAMERCRGTAHPNPERERRALVIPSRERQRPVWVALRHPFGEQS